MSYTGRCYCGDLKYEFDEPIHFTAFMLLSENVDIYQEEKRTPLS